MLGWINEDIVGNILNKVLISYLYSEWKLTLIWTNELTGGDSAHWQVLNRLGPWINSWRLDDRCYLVEGIKLYNYKGGMYQYLLFVYHWVCNAKAAGPNQTKLAASNRIPPCCSWHASMYRCMGRVIHPLPAESSIGIKFRPLFVCLWVILSPLPLPPPTSSSTPLFIDCQWPSSFYFLDCY